MKKLLTQYDLLLFILCAITLSTCKSDISKGTPAKDPFSQDEAAELVLQNVVKPDELDHPVIVFAWPVILQAGDKIDGYRLPEMEESGAIRDISDETWFFWIDDAPAAKFAHPTRFVFINQETGELDVIEDLWWPLLNGEGLWVETKDYWNEDNWAFTNLEWRRSISGTSLETVIVEHSAGTLLLSQSLREITFGDIQQPASPGAAIVINGWKSPQTVKEDMETDADGMHDIFDDLGFDTTYLGPPEDDNPDRDGEVDLGTLFDWFNKKAEELVPCQTLFVYITSHGYAKDGEGIADGIPEGILDHLLEKFNPGVHIIVIIDTCYAGSFIDNLIDVADVIITATSATQSAYGDYDPEDDPNKDDQGSEFTSGFIEDWNRILDDHEEVERVRQDAEATGKNFWEALAEASFWTAFEKDAAANSGKSLPLIDFGGTLAEPTVTPLPTETVPIEGTYHVNSEVIDDQAEHAEVIQFLKEFNIKISFGSIIFDGPDPWVDVVGELTEDGKFSAQGKGTVAGFTDILVTFEGEVGEGHLMGDYTMGADGGLPAGLPIVYRIEGQRVDSSATPTPISGAETVEEFFHVFSSAMRSANVDLLLERLHPSVQDLYGTSACIAYLESVTNPTFEVEILETSGPTSWTWEIDDHSIPLDVAYTVEVTFHMEDQVQRSVLHLAPIDEQLYWFTDCGDPLP